MLLLRLISFHVLIYASIVFMLGMLPESTPTYSALAVGDVFLFGSLSFGEKASSWCQDLVKMIVEFFKGMLAKQTVANLAGYSAAFSLNCRGRLGMQLSSPSSIRTTRPLFGHGLTWSLHMRQRLLPSCWEWLTSTTSPGLPRWINRLS
jgi:hypothetical protein